MSLWLWFLLMGVACFALIAVVILIERQKYEGEDVRALWSSVKRRTRRAVARAKRIVDAGRGTK